MLQASECHLKTGGEAGLHHGVVSESCPGDRSIPRKYQRTPLFQYLGKPPSRSVLVTLLCQGGDLYSCPPLRYDKPVEVGFLFEFAYKVVDSTGVQQPSNKASNKATSNASNKQKKKKSSQSTKHKAEVGLIIEVGLIEAKLLVSEYMILRLTSLVVGHIVISHHHHHHHHHHATAAKN